MYIETIEIDDHILDKIETKHGVAFEEAEEACLSDEKQVRRTRDGLYKIFSQSLNGRYLLIVMVQLEGSRWKIVTARDMTDNERKLCRQIKGR